MFAASPPKFVSLEEVLAAAEGVTNMTLAHEIAVDSDFQLRKHEPEDGRFYHFVHFEKSQYTL